MSRLGVCTIQGTRLTVLLLLTSLRFLSRYPYNAVSNEFLPTSASQAARLRYLVSSAKVYVDRKDRSVIKYIIKRLKNVCNASA